MLGRSDFMRQQNSWKDMVRPAATGATRCSREEAVIEAGWCGGQERSHSCARAIGAGPPDVARYRGRALLLISLHHRGDHHQ